MIKTIVGFIVGLLGMLLFYSAFSSGSFFHYSFEYYSYRAILPVIGIILILLSLKLIDIEKFQKQPLANVTFKINHVILFLIVFLLVVMLLIFLVAYSFTQLLE